MMAGAVIFNVRIAGKGGHGAAPHQTVDPIVAAAQIINGLQTVISRNVPPLETAVLSVCKINGGTAFNIIPQEVTFDGTIRTFKESVYEQVVDRFETIVHQMAEGMGCQADITIEQVTLPVDNDAGLVSLMTDVVKEVQPKAKVDTSHRTMGSEDFSFMMDDIPGCFMMVGSSNPEKGLDYGHHHPKFDIDESCLAPAVAILAKGAVEILKQSPKSI
jgi:amidohydrolase